MLDEEACGRGEGEAEGLVPPAAPEPLEAFLGDVFEGAPGCRVLPEFAAGVEDVWPEDEAEEERGKEEDCFEGCDN